MKVMAEDRVVTPVGFLEVLVEVDKSVPPDYLLFTRSKISAYAKDGSSALETNVVIGSKQAIPLRAGKYKVFASFGGIPSKDIELEIVAGEVRKVVFYFGKET